MKSKTTIDSVGEEQEKKQPKHGTHKASRKQGLRWTKRKKPPARIETTGRQHAPGNRRATGRRRHNLNITRIESTPFANERSEKRVGRKTK